MKGNALLSRCFRNIGILAPGEALEADDAAIGLEDLQTFIDSLGAKRPTMYARARNVGTLVSGTQTYTVGSGGAFNFARPVWIDEAKCQQTSSGGTVLETRVTILTERQYADIPVKAITTGIVTALFYDYAFASSLGTITVYPYPNISGLKLVLYGPVAVTGFADLTTDYLFPPGYAEAIEYNVSVRLSVKYPKANVPQLLMKLARESMIAISGANFRPELLQMDAALLPQQRGGGYWDVISGT